MLLGEIQVSPLSLADQYMTLFYVCLFKDLYVMYTADSLTSIRGPQHHNMSERSFSIRHITAFWHLGHKTALQPDTWGTF